MWEDVIKDDQDIEVPTARTYALSVVGLRQRLASQLTKTGDSQAKCDNEKHKPQA